jgi:hypothetical protein
MAEMALERAMAAGREPAEQAPAEAVESLAVAAEPAR